MKVITNRGELKVTNRPMAETPIFYDFNTGKFVKLEPTIVDGEVTDKWVTTDPPQQFYNPVDHKWYAHVPIMVDGEMTDRWIEA